MDSQDTLRKLGVTVEDLSGPKVDRRTTMKLLAATGVTAMAGCAGSDDSDDGDDGNGGGTGGDDDGTGADPSDIQMGGTLQAASLNGEWDNVEPLRIAASQVQQWLRNYAHGGLRTNGDLEVVGEIATDWEVDLDPFSITLDLREGVQFHSGREVLAEDFQFAADRARNHPESNIVGESNFLQDPVAGQGVEVLDDYRVRYNYSEPYAPGLIDLTTRGRIATPLDQNAIDEMGDDQHNLTPVGTGPFEVTEHVTGETLSMEAFDDFYMEDEAGNSIPYLDAIDIDFIPETETAISALVTGEIEFVDNVPPGQAGQLDGQGGARLEIEPLLRYEALVLNHARDFAETVDQRRAIAKLFDNERFVEQALDGYGSPLFGTLTPTHEWVFRDEFDEPGAPPGGELKDPTQRFDPEEGRRLLEETGLAGEEFTIKTTDGNERTARIARSILEDNSNGMLSVEVELITFSQLVALLDDPHDFDATFLGGGGPDPDGMLYNFYRLPPEEKHPELADTEFAGPRSEGYDGIWNEQRYINQDVHDMLAEQRTLIDQDERKEVLWEIEDTLISDVARVFMSVDDSILGVGEDVNDFSIRDENQDFHQVWKS